MAELTLPEKEGFEGGIDVMTLNCGIVFS